MEKVKDINMYNEQFAIPQMISTYKALSRKIQKNIIFIVTISLYIMLFNELSIKQLNIKFYFEEINILITFVIFIIIAASTKIQIYKIFILLRQLDDELKIFFSKEKMELRDQLDVAANMTSFVVSDSFISDILLTGPKRHPSIPRLRGIQFIFNMAIYVITMFIIIHFMNGLEIEDNTIVQVLGIITSVFIYGVYYITKKYFYERSIFLYKTEKGKDLIISYDILLDSLMDHNRQVNTRMQNDTSVFEEIKIQHEQFDKMVVQIKNEYNKLDWKNIFDDQKYIIIIFRGIKTINLFINGMSKNYENIYIDSYTSKMNHQNHTYTGNMYLDKIKNFNNDFNNFTQLSNYELAMNYHKYDTGDDKIFRKPLKIIYGRVKRANAS